MTLSFIRVLVVEDAQPFQKFIYLALLNRPELRVIAWALDGLEGVQKAEELQPDLILLDLGLPKLNGIKAAREIRKVSPRSIILFVSQESSADVVQEALSTGASGYVVKIDAGTELLPAVDSVLQGQQFISHRFALCDFAHAAHGATP
ncbi:MAG TPA: response regulator transcription factor [Candidatus Angelobacter sp.]